MFFFSFQFAPSYTRSCPDVFVYIYLVFDVASIKVRFAYFCVLAMSLLEIHISEPFGRLRTTHFSVLFGLVKTLCSQRMAATYPIVRVLLD